MSETSNAVDVRDEKGRFKVGNKPPGGRPVGSRNKIANDFISAYCEDFAVHGKAVIEKVRVENPAFYLKLGIDLLPKDVNVNLGGGMFVVRAPAVALSSEAWQAVVSRPEASSAEIIDLKPVDVSPVLPEPIGD